jgi:hypothetical protein
MTITTEQTVRTMHELVSRFNELAQQEKWFEIQDEFFSENVKSIEPPNSPYLGYAEGKSSVRTKADDFVKKITQVHRVFTTEPILTGNHFTVGREMDLTVEGHGRIQIHELIVYEVRNGEIVLEQFFY